MVQQLAEVEGQRDTLEQALQTADRAASTVSQPAAAHSTRDMPMQDQLMHKVCAGQGHCRLATNVVFLRPYM